VKKYFLLLLFLYSSFIFAKPPNKIKNEGYLICIHGFLAKSMNMYFMKKNFKKNNWDVINWDYNGRAKNIEEHAKDLVKSLQDCAEKKPNEPINFIAHSMGGLVLRAVLNDPACPIEAKLGKVVLLAPPNKGSLVGRYLNKYLFCRKIAKDKAGSQLMEKESFEYLGPFPHPKERILVISGNLSFNPLFHKPNDGLVSVDETFLDTPHEHIIIPRGHITMVFSKKVFCLAKDFFEK
jgi:pimeloyl-ACP methyl ester carboxylesterase